MTTAKRPASRVSKTIRFQPGATLKGELAAMMLACADQTPAGVRDAAIIGILYTCGLRRSELVNLDLADYDPDAGTVTIVVSAGTVTEK